MVLTEAAKVEAAAKLPACLLLLLLLTSVEDKPEFQKAPVTISAWLEPLSSWLPPALQPARLALSCIDDVELLQRTVWSGLVDHKKVEH